MNVQLALKPLLMLVEVLAELEKTCA